MKTPTETLRDEHMLILRALDLLETAAARVERGLATPERWWAGVIAWLRGFADRNHHAKEERALFPAMARAGVPAEAGGPIAVMQEEHGQGRALLQVVADGEARPRVVAARRYIELLRNHIEKEHEVLFPLADDLLDRAAQDALAREFAAVTAEMGRHASLEHAAAALQALVTELAGSPDAAGTR
jgi:hemerythrin-like domain-containing protein